ncbi:TetR/AcrR family transcriptional regulator [Actinacidiphila glaucinigra]|uniref:TetR/AcrR family transcriptional regulator n=1 Tax=Actinacidiphila glaucinigra TaxID=235986 RepID=UPI0036C2DEA9
MTAPVVTTRRGSRLTPEREATVHASTLDLLREVGYEALTMDAVAARGHCSKATLYRQWGGKAALVAMALRHGRPVGPGDIDTGSLRGDLRALLTLDDDRQLERDCALMRGLAMALHGNPDLMRALHEVMIQPERSGLDTLLRRAVDRGEIRADDPALPYLLQMLLGAFFTRNVLEDLPPTRAYLLAFLDAVILPALGLRPGTDPDPDPTPGTDPAAASAP